MRKLTKLQLACVVALMTMLCSSYASAFNTSVYATSSRLASGKWVKVSIPESGVYEITYDELRDMGFSNPESVHVYGAGGNRISEQLNGTHTDDLKQVPILRANDKICFYGNGPIALSISDYNSNPHYTRTFNPYSQVGCYFLSYVNCPTSLGYFYHERELMSVSNSGKEMLGEDFSKRKVLVDYYLPHLSDSTIVLQTAIAASASEVSYANAVIHSGAYNDTTSYSLASSRIKRLCLLQLRLALWLVKAP